MRIPQFLLIVLFLTLISFSAVAGQAPDKAKMQELQKASMRAAQPGPEHEILKGLAGNWQQTVNLWMSPGTDPMVIEGTCQMTMILGGRFLQSKSVSGEGGHKMETMTIVGFDRRTEKFTTVGFDTWGTYSTSAEGEYDVATKTITMAGTDYDPIMDHTQVYEFRTILTDKDNFAWEVVFLDKELAGSAEEFKMVEITYKRQK
ncbi:MAG: DUF1579 family protein [candidate division Zixibacteria bacterium]